MYFFQSVKALSEKAPQGLGVKVGKRGDSRLISTAASKTCRLSFKVHRPKAVKTKVRGS